MNLIEIILLAAALGIDCLVLSFSQGLIFTKNRVKNSIQLALTMGLFQGGMPLIGYGFAELINNYVASFTDWIIFGIFMFLGCKFIYEALQNDKKNDTICCIGLKCLISMGFATSIDALGAGVSLRFSETNILLSILLIGTVSFFMSLTGFFSGNIFKFFPPKYLEISGGIILIILAIKSVI